MKSILLPYNIYVGQNRTAWQKKFVKALVEEVLQVGAELLEIHMNFNKNPAFLERGFIKFKIPDLDGGFFNIY
ncbi:hypothetical protein [Candidatus Avelusimicrobium sp.]